MERIYAVDMRELQAMVPVTAELESLEKQDGCELQVQSTNDDEKRPSIVEVDAQINPWVEVASAWPRQTGPRLGPEPIRKAIVTVNDADNDILATMEMILPVVIPPVHKICVFWDAATKLSVNIETSESTCSYRSEEIQQAQEDTWTILDAAFRSRFPIERSHFIVLFRSVRANLQKGSNPILCSNQISEPGTEVGLLRYKDESYHPYIFEKLLDRKPRANLVEHPSRNYEELLEDVAYLAVSKLDTRRTDFLHEASPDIQLPLGKRFSYVWPQTRCTVDAVPFRITQFAILMPSILHRLQVCMVADKLLKTILADVHFNNPNLVVTAISTPMAVEETNYERFEFLGDSLLKICTSLQLLAEYPPWLEGDLTKTRANVISNERLAKAALQKGLDRFIITEIFTGSKWRPIYVQDLLDKVHMPSKRQMSAEVLADVVEALFGAAMLDGGMPKTLACMRVFLPEIDWQSLEDRRKTVLERAPADVNLPPNLELLESLIGYFFVKKALLVEAMTHASCKSGTANYQRLEFLGDATLDSLIVNTVYNQEVELSRIKMHRLRTAFVNADFLAFICMERITKQETEKVLEDEGTHRLQTSADTVPLALWTFMRSQGLTEVQLETSKRHLLLRHDINAALERESHYPWALLSRLQAPKFYSDIVESLLGAVYIDAGLLDNCERVIERMGILRHLLRAIRDDVHTLHPKEELQILADVGHETVKYVIGLKKELIENVERCSYTCEVFVGEQSIVLVTDESGKKKVLETKAAEAAVKILNERGRSGAETFEDSQLVSMI